MVGLCGNFDGDAENDFASRQGVLEPTADLFGNSWRLSLLCPEVDSADAWHPCTVWMGTGMGNWGSCAGTVVGSRWGGSPSAWLAKG